MHGHGPHVGPHGGFAGPHGGFAGPHGPHMHAAPVPVYGPHHPHHLYGPPPPGETVLCCNLF